MVEPIEGIKAPPQTEVAVRHDMPGFTIEPSRGLGALKLKEVWEYRELLYFMVWRDIKVRYKQTVLGVAWVIVQPVVNMVVFSMLFGGLLKVPSGDVPYPLFTYAALLPWNYFARSITSASISLVSNSHLITKVYFPRLIIPISTVLAGLVDLGIAFLVLIGLMIYFGVSLSIAMLMLPVFLLVAMLTALGFGLWLGALNVRYRDVGYLVPFLVQMWMYATPVIYGSTLIPERYRFLLGLNPMTIVVEGFRWALLGQAAPASSTGPWILALSLLGVIVVLVSGLLFFRHTERTFADIV